MTLLDRLSSPGPKRMLALDGGGIRGAITLGFLEKIESILRERHANPNLKLRDYFDLVGGTSTGSIIAASLAMGMDASELTDMYLRLGGRVFGKKKWKKWEALFDVGPLQEELATAFGDRTLGDPSLTTGLCIVAKRADTRSTWPLINHPLGKYYEDNKDIPLREAVRASTAAPVYFVPEKLEVGRGQVGAFVDGGVSMFNNPGLQLLYVATLKGFPFHWQTGKERLLLVSIGTGYWSEKLPVDDVAGAKAWDWASQVPAMLMEDASWQNQLILQWLSDSPTPWEIDSEIGDLSEDFLLGEPALSYVRYNARLEREALEEYGLGHLAPRLKSLREMSEGHNARNLADIGAAFAERMVASDHFPSAFDLSG